MADTKRETAQRKRAEARDRRRKQSKSESAADEETSDDQRAGSDGDSGDDQLVTMKQAAKVAAAGAAVGAATAAARALTKHDDAPDSDSQPEPEGSADEDGPEEQDQDTERVEEPDREQEQREERRPAAESRTSSEELPPGASVDQSQSVVRAAREQLEALLGRTPESVSALERTHDGWLVTVDVVEVSRVPESTDVLASYEIELDEDSNLRRYARVRRYHRSQADYGGAA
jgi:hypothetical protein